MTKLEKEEKLIMSVLNMNKLYYPGLIYNEYTNQAEMIYNDILITVFINDETGELDVCAFAVGETGFFDVKVKWVTCSKENNIDDNAYKGAIEIVCGIVKAKTTQRNCTDVFGGFGAMGFGGL